MSTVTLYVIAEVRREAVLSVHDQYRRGELTLGEISEATGVSKSTVKRIMDRAETSPYPCHSDVQARPRGNKGGRAKTGENGTPPVTILQASEVTRDLAVSEMLKLLHTAKGALLTATIHNDGSPKAISAECQAIGINLQILRTMGDWCGLDGSIGNAPKSEVIDGSAVDRMDLETMRALLSSLIPGSEAVH